jgi:cellobiose-specific phosphotransferase system component IIA
MPRGVITMIADGHQTWSAAPENLYLAHDPCDRGALGAILQQGEPGTRVEEHASKGRIDGRGAWSASDIHGATSKTKTRKDQQRDAMERREIKLSRCHGLQCNVISCCIIRKLEILHSLIGFVAPPYQSFYQQREDDEPISDAIQNSMSLLSQRENQNTIVILTLLFVHSQERIRRGSSPDLHRDARESFLEANDALHIAHLAHITRPIRLAPVRFK